MQEDTPLVRQKKHVVLTEILTRKASKSARSMSITVDRLSATFFCREGTGGREGDADSACRPAHPCGKADWYVAGPGFPSWVSAKGSCAPREAQAQSRLGKGWRRALTSRSIYLKAPPASATCPSASQRKDERKFLHSSDQRGEEGRHKAERSKGDRGVQRTSEWPACADDPAAQLPGVQSAG